MRADAGGDRAGGERGALSTALKSGAIGETGRGIDAGLGVEHPARRGSVAASGATFLRGGAFKPRTSPYAFQGLGEEGLKHLAEARERTGLPVATELMDPRDLELVARYADIIQIGTRKAGPGRARPRRRA